MDNMVIGCAWGKGVGGWFASFASSIEQRRPVLGLDARGDGREVMRARATHNDCRPANPMTAKVGPARTGAPSFTRKAMNVLGVGADVDAIFGGSMQERWDVEWECVWRNERERRGTRREQTERERGASALAVSYVVWSPSPLVPSNSVFQSTGWTSAGMDDNPGESTPYQRTTIAGPHVLTLLKFVL